MEFRDRTLKLDRRIRPVKRTSRQRIRESIFRLWSSFQRDVQQVDPSASPSDYAERVEERVAVRLKGDREITAVDEAVRRTFRDIVQNDRRNKFRQRMRFAYPNSPPPESIPDPNSDRFAAAIEDKSDIEWQIEEIRRRVDPEMMTTLEQLYGFHSEQWTIDNLAKKMGIRKNTLEKRLSRTFAKLRSDLPFRV